MTKAKRSKDVVNHLLVFTRIIWIVFDGFIVIYIDLFVVVVHVNGVRFCLRNAATNGPTVPSPSDIRILNVYGMILTG
jgi:hypothetical protein